jgi:hypothetical protein
MRNNASRRLGVRMLEDDAFPGQTVKVRCECTLGAEETHAVGAGGTEGDQDQVGLGCRCERETNTNKDQTPAGNGFPDHDSKCRGCTAIDQNYYLKTSKPLFLTSIELRVQSMYLLLRDFQSHGDVVITTHR